MSGLRINDMTPERLRDLEVDAKLLRGVVVYKEGRKYAFVNFDTPGQASAAHSALARTGWTLAPYRDKPPTPVPSPIPPKPAPPSPTHSDGGEGKKPTTDRKKQPQLPTDVAVLLTGVDTEVSNDFVNRRLQRYAVKKWERLPGEEGQVGGQVRAFFADNATAGRCVDELHHRRLEGSTLQLSARILGTRASLQLDDAGPRDDRKAGAGAGTGGVVSPRRGHPKPLHPVQGQGPDTPRHKRDKPSGSGAPHIPRDQRPSGRGRAVEHKQHGQILQLSRGQTLILQHERCQLLSTLRRLYGDVVIQMSPAGDFIQFDGARAVAAREELRNAIKDFLEEHVVLQLPGKPPLVAVLQKKLKQMTDFLWDNGKEGAAEVEEKLRGSKVIMHASDVTALQALRNNVQQFRVQSKEIKLPGGKLPGAVGRWVKDIAVLTELSKGCLVLTGFTAQDLAEGERAILRGIRTAENEQAERLIELQIMEQQFFEARRLPWLQQVARQHGVTYEFVKAPRESKVTTPTSRGGYAGRGGGRGGRGGGAGPNPIDARRNGLRVSGRRASVDAFLDDFVIAKSALQDPITFPVSISGPIFLKPFRSRVDQLIETLSEEGSEAYVSVKNAPKSTADHKSQAALSVRIIAPAGEDLGAMKARFEAIAAAKQQMDITLPIPEYKALRQEMLRQRDPQLLKKEFESERGVLLYFKDPNTVEITGFVDEKEDLVSALRDIAQSRVVRKAEHKIQEDNEDLYYVARELLFRKGAFNHVQDQHGVRVKPGRGYPVVCLVYGEEKAVGAAVSAIRSTMSKAYDKLIRQDVELSPGLNDVLNDGKVARKIELENKTVIRWGDARLPASPSSAEHAAFTLPSGQTISIRCGNIIVEPVDAIVNAANENLTHAGGLAAQVANAAGNAWKEEGLRWAAANPGVLGTGGAMLMGSGNITTCRGIINAVGPVWRGGNQNEPRLLCEAIIASVQQAELKGYASIALPALSSGIFGFPKDRCARVMCNALQAHFKHTPRSSVKHVRIVLFEQDEAELFAKEFAAQLGAAPAASASSSRDSKSPGLFGMARSLFSSGSKAQSPAPPLPIEAQYAVPEYQWQWMEDGRKWMSYDPDQNAQIEAAYLRKDPTCDVVGDLLKVKNNKDYQVDFTKMKQRNKATGYERAIQRIPKSAEQLQADRKRWAALVESSRAQLASPASTTAGAGSTGTPDSDDGPAPICVRVYGLTREAVDRTAGALRQLEQKNRVTEEVVVPSSSAETIAELKEVVKQYGVDLSPIPGSKKLNVSGVGEGMVLRAKSALLEYLREAEASPPPDEWEENTDDKKHPALPKVYIFDVKAGSAEWKRIEDRMRQTMSNFTLVRIQRIQNPWLWEMYAFERKKLADKNKGKANELELFHGTRDTDPEMIYGDEVGFDLRFANQGLWGKGLYFATNAQYSRAYAYPPAGNGEKQFLLTRAAVGEWTHLKPDGSLTKPPVKPKQGQLFKVERYDTVRCTHGDSINYVIYASKRAYPSYLITFKDS